MPSLAPIDDRKVLTLRELAAELGYSYGTMRKAVVADPALAKALGGWRFGPLGEWRFRKAAVEAYVAGVEPPQEPAVEWPRLRAVGER